jgi:tetratricopeptide (TPR) repeat protein
MENLYQLLGVSNFADLEDIQRAYNKMYGELFTTENPLANIPKIKLLKDALELFNNPEKRIDYDAGLRLFLEDLETLYGSAVDALAGGDFDQCVLVLKECIKKNPKEPEFFETMGLAYQLGGNMDEAAKSFQQGLRLTKAPARFHWYLGDLYRSLHDDDQADTHYLDAAEGFKEVLKVDPRNTEALEMLADTYAKMKWFEEALELYDKLLAQFPYKAEYHRLIGVVYYELDWLDESYDHFQESLRNAPDDASTYMYLGLLYFKRRLLGLAIDYLEESLKRSPGQPEVTKLIEKIREIKQEVGHTVEEIIHEPNPDAMVEGRVKWYNPETGVGVLSCEEYPEVLLHYSALGADIRDRLEKGATVRFGVVKDQVGLIAVQVELIESGEGSDTFPGVVSKFDPARKLGSITTSDKRDIMFHFAGLQKDAEEKLEVGLEVLFEVKTIKGLGDNPIEQAINVRLRKKPRKPAPEPAPPPTPPTGTPEK